MEDLTYSYVPTRRQRRGARLARMRFVLPGLPVMLAVWIFGFVGAGVVMGGQSLGAAVAQADPSVMGGLVAVWLFSGLRPPGRLYRGGEEIHVDYGGAGFAVRGSGWSSAYDYAHVRFVSERGQFVSVGMKPTRWTSRRLLLPIDAVPLKARVRLQAHTRGHSRIRAQLDSAA